VLIKKKSVFFFHNFIEKYIISLLFANILLVFQFI